MSYRYSYLFIFYVNSAWCALNAVAHNTFVYCDSKLHIFNAFSKHHLFASFMLFVTKLSWFEFIATCTLHGADNDEKEHEWMKRAQTAFPIILRNKVLHVFDAGCVCVFFLAFAGVWVSQSKRKKMRQRKISIGKINAIKYEKYISIDFVYFFLLSNFFLFFYSVCLFSHCFSFRIAAQWNRFSSSKNGIYARNASIRGQM